MVKPLILDINSGNILSLKNIISKFNEKVKISNLDSDLDSSTHIFLPGVGSYSEVMNKLKKNINSYAKENKCRQCSADCCKYK